MSDQVEFVTVQYPDGTSRVDMTRLTDGRVMCQLCFAYVTRDRLKPDPAFPGCVTDVCCRCAIRDAEAVIARIRALADHWSTTSGRKAAARELRELLPARDARPAPADPRPRTDDTTREQLDAIVRAGQQNPEAQRVYPPQANEQEPQ